MKSTIHIAAGLLCLSLLPGCGQSTAAPAPMPTQMVKPTASLAPGIETGLVRIPEMRKSTPAVTKQKESSTEREPSVAVNYAEQDQQQEKSQRRQSRQEGKSQIGDEGQDAKKLKKVPGEAKRDDPRVSLPVAVAPLQSDSSAPPISPSSSSTPSTQTSAAGSNFPVVYGSATSTTTRAFKKPALPSNVPSWFSDNDKDGDGQLSMNEWPADKMDEFKKHDRNNDGIITLEEAMRTVPKAAPVVAAATPTATSPASTTPATTTPTVASTTTTPPPIVSNSSTAPAMTMRVGAPAGTPMSDDDAKRRVDQIFQFIDANKDNVLDEKEIENSRTIKSIEWKKYDANRDGKLDKAEAIALYKAEGNNMRGGGGGPFAGRNPDEMAKTMFDNIDRNKTGKVTKEQFPGFMRERFEEYDTNKDGFVDFEEYKAGFAKFMQNRGGAGGRGGPGGGRGDSGMGGGRGFGRGGF